MSDHPLDRATLLEDAGQDVRRGQTSEDYWAFVGPFGGASAALLMRAVMEHPARICEPLAQTVNYCAPLAKGEFTLAARAARTNRSTQHWTLELKQGGETVLTGSMVTAERRETWSYAPASPPPVASPETLPRYGMPGRRPAWIDRYEFRFAAGAPDVGRDPAGPASSSLSHLWLRDSPPRPLDHVALAGLADAFFARIFHARRQMVPFGTVSLTTYFSGTKDEIAEQGDAALLGVADAKRYHRSYFDQSVELWSTKGTLLATGVQVCYFKI